MEILGIGMPELVFIFIIALLVMGPKDMQAAGKTIGKWLRSIITSDGWKIFQQTSRELRTLPNRLMREANEELGQVEQEINNSIGSSVSGNPVREYPPVTRSQAVTSSPPENRTATPVLGKKEDENDSEQDV